MGLRFEWDPRKAASNLRKHQVTFEEAATVFGDTMSVTIHDPDHTFGLEERFITVGTSSMRRVLVVIHCDRGDGLRLISPRRATSRERRQYEKGT
jgi:uncharacterized protein